MSHIQFLLTMMDSLHEYIFGDVMINELVKKAVTSSFSSLDESADHKEHGSKRHRKAGSVNIRLDNFKEFLISGSRIKGNFERANWATVFIDSHIFLNQSMA